jgi:hypothetical protein
MNREAPARECWLGRAAVVACCVIGLVLAGCRGTSGTTTPSSVHAGDAQNGTTVTLHPGQTLVVALASTYWTFAGSSDPKVLASVGTPVAAPGTCPPGAGCGTVSQAFHAVGPGTAQVSASRVSCGEAMRCTGGAGSYRLTVQVTAAGG